MWSNVRSQFPRQKVRLEIVRKMIELGIRTGEDDRLYVRDVEIGFSALARAVGVDRRVVKQTVSQIKKTEALKEIFSMMTPAGASLVPIASKLGYSTLIIEADPRAAGVISTVTKVLADHSIVIRQALAEDPDMNPDARLTLVVEGNVTGDVVTQLERLIPVKSITVRK